MASRPRMRGNVKAKLSLDPVSYANFKKALKELERAARKEIIEKALLAGGAVIHADAESRAPGPLELALVGGRSLRKRVDPMLAKVVKAGGKFAAVGPDKDHWYYRFFEFGATPHDIKPVNASALAFEGTASSRTVFAAFAKRTGGVKKQPFLRPAVDKNKQAAIDAMGDVLAREIKKAAKA